MRMAPPSPWATLIQSVGVVYDVDHCLWDISGLDRGLFTTDTKLWLMPPNLFTSVSNLLNSTYSDSLVNGGLDSGMFNAELCRPTVDEFSNSTRAAPIMGGDAPDFAFLYQNGSPGGTGATTGAYADNTHPGTQTLDGTPLYAKQFGVVMLNAIGAADIKEPTITGATFASDNSYVDITVDLPNGGDLSTLRIERGEAAPDPLPAHYHEVMGFEIGEVGDADSLRRAPLSGYTVEITNVGTGTAPSRTGTVRITHPTAFAENDRIDYLRGGATAYIGPWADMAYAELHKDLLIETTPSLDSVLSEYKGVPVRPVPTQIVAPAVAGGSFAPAWQSTSGDLAMATLGTTFTGVPNTGVKKATVIVTYSPQDDSTSGASRHLLYLHQLTDIFLASTGSLVVRWMPSFQSSATFDTTTISGWGTKDFAVVVAYDSTQAVAADRVKARLVNLTDGTEFAFTAGTGFPALDADLPILPNVGIYTVYAAQTSTRTSASQGDFERVQVIVDEAVDLTDLSGLHVSGALWTPRRSDQSRRLAAGRFRMGRFA